MTTKDFKIIFGEKSEQTKFEGLHRIAKKYGIVVNKGEIMGIKKDKKWLWTNYSQNVKRRKVIDIRIYVGEGRMTEVIYNVVTWHYNIQPGHVREYFANKNEYFFYQLINFAIIAKWGEK